MWHIFLFQANGFAGWPSARLVFQLPAPEPFSHLLVAALFQNQAFSKAMPFPKLSSLQALLALKLLFTTRLTCFQSQKLQRQHSVPAWKTTHRAYKAEPQDKLCEWCVCVCDSATCRSPCLVVSQLQKPLATLKPCVSLSETKAALLFCFQNLLAAVCLLA